MNTKPTIENAASIVGTRTAEGSTVRFYNADGCEFMTLTSDDSVFVATFKRDNPRVDHTETVYTLTRNVFKALNAKDEELVRVEFDGTAKQPFVLGGAIASYFINDRGRYVFRISFDGQAPRDVYASPRVSDVDVSPKAVGSTIESISIVDLGDKRVVRCYSGRKAILTYVESKGERA